MLYFILQYFPFIISWKLLNAFQWKNFRDAAVQFFETEYLPNRRCDSTLISYCELISGPTNNHNSKRMNWLFRIRMPIKLHCFSFFFLLFFNIQQSLILFVSHRYKLMTIIKKSKDKQIIDLDECLLVLLKTNTTSPTRKCQQKYRKPFRLYHHHIAITVRPLYVIFVIVITFHHFFLTSIQYKCICNGLVLQEICGRIIAFLVCFINVNFNNFSHHFSNKNLLSVQNCVYSIVIKQVKKRRAKKRKYTYWVTDLEFNKATTY